MADILHVLAGRSLRFGPRRTRNSWWTQTVLIGTALGVFGLAVAAEVLGIGLANCVLDLGITDAVVGWAIVIAGTLAIVNLSRSEKA